MSNFKQFFEQKVVPVTGKMSSNKIIKALTSSMMATMPLSLGTSIVAILANFPIASWTNFLAAHGINVHATAIIGGTTQIMGLFLAFLVAYNYTKLLGEDAITGGVLSLGTFIILMPQTYALADGASLSVLQLKYLGSSGIFVSMIVGILIPCLYCFLQKKGFVIKFPDSVPEMITKSLSPTFIAMIVFIVVFGVRIAFGYTPYGNIFDFINNTVGQPIMLLGSSPISLIMVYAIGNLFWCFGIHPGSVLTFYTPVILTVITGNIEAFQKGSPLPYLTFIIVYTFIMLGGTGSTLGLAFDMFLFSKSKRFKALGKLAIIPNIFNINEPLIFGTPIIFNPIFIIPMIATPFLNGGIAILLVKLGAYSTYNPTIKMPWTMPAPITALIQTGVWASLGVCLVIVATAILYYPFFKFADKQAVKEEMQEETAQAV
ncbi:permease IIC component [Anaerocolumna cellulosilytica]|uniref:Permease IIC component n=1 Tax=Anaerocolumna cellulosilytica TaxID=433286 RepID=A0A6S6R332_9FIRM|nr:PTS transporter subunit EIIC [Anaerocolumna cellulosilytica]MBB5196673.1 PTS system cellobiose-specific IIC component [Anaerocolumna cellulosilytica]BCJ93935.1 permease IIC component [Anaerocolumna cellulosilytica]